MFLRSRWKFFLSAILSLVIFRAPLHRPLPDDGPPPLAKRESADRLQVQLKETDFIMAHEGWDSSPIVLESHKLIFFTTKKVGCTVWKRLFRRMMGYDDWQDRQVSPHNPATNGLVYLRDLPLEKANQIINSPLYTRAIFVRDPKERFLSAFLEKSLLANGTHILDICYHQHGGSTRSKDEIWKQTRTFQGFVDITRKKCKDDHWKAQSLRMGPNIASPLWQTLDFVGHMDNVQEDAKRLLQRIGAWEEFGKSGWDRPLHDHAIFQSTENVQHKSGAPKQVAQYYTPELEREIDRRFGQDYEVRELELKRKPIDYSGQ